MKTTVETPDDVLKRVCIDLDLDLAYDFLFNQEG